jgi:hypothetical protein
MNQERWISEVTNLGWMTEVWFLAGAGIFLYATMPDHLQLSTQPPIQQALALEVKWLVHEIKQLSLFNAEV